MFLQVLAPPDTSLGEKDCIAATKVPTDTKIGGEQGKWPLSSVARRWAWCSSSCRWRLPTAVWLSLGSWAWSSSEMWVVSGQQVNLWEMHPGCACPSLKAQKQSGQKAHAESESSLKLIWKPIDHYVKIWPIPEAPFSILLTLCTTLEGFLSPPENRVSLPKSPSPAVTVRLGRNEPSTRPQYLRHCPATGSLYDAVVLVVHAKGIHSLLMLEVSMAVCSLAAPGLFSLLFVAECKCQQLPEEVCEWSEKVWILGEDPA